MHVGGFHHGSGHPEQLQLPGGADGVGRSVSEHRDAGRVRVGLCVSVGVHAVGDELHADHVGHLGGDT